MIKLAIYPGSFDPATNGHIDVIARAARIFDDLIVGVAKQSPKSTTFTVDERVNLLRESCSEFKNVKIESFDNLLVDWAVQKDAGVIVRGLRALSDFEYEFQMALTNRKLSPEIETVFLMTREECSCISSSMIKEIAKLGGDVSNFVPEIVVEALRKKYNL